MSYLQQATTEFVLFLIALCFLTSAANAQKTAVNKIDSLNIELSKTIHDTSRIFILNSIAKEYIKESDYNNATEMANKALALSQKIKYKRGEGKALSTIGNIAIDQGNFNDAMKTYNSSLKLMEEIGDKKGISDAYSNKGIIYCRQSMHAEGLKNFIASLNIDIKRNDSTGMGFMYCNIGNVYMFLENYDEALTHFTKATEILERIGERRSAAIIYSNIGNVYRKKGDYKKALENHLNTIKILDEVKEGKHAYATVYHNLGADYAKLENYEEALKYYRKALELSKEIDDKYSTANISGDIGILYRLNNDYTNSRTWLNTAIPLMKEVGALNILSKLYNELGMLDSAAGNYKAALENYKTSIEYRDNYSNNENTKKLTQLQMNYEFSQKEDSIRMANDKEMAIKDATVKAHQAQKWLLVIGIIILLAKGGLLLIQNNQRKKLNKKLLKLNSELDEADKIKTKFFSLINHDLRSPISNVIKILRLQQNNRELLDAPTRTRLENETLQSAEHLLESMEDLLLWSKGQMQQFKPEIKVVPVEELFGDLKKYVTGIDNIAFTFDNPEKLSLKTDKDFLKTIMRNLTANAIKVTENQSNPSVKWRAWQENNNTVISITDNGPGSSMDEFRALYDETATVGIKTGLGLHLIRDLAKAIECKVIVKTNKMTGTEITITHECNS
ncbi:tetratricopeptide repeat-containing sensor histidine kinase [Polluticaenibacter yanchengensis]|uniref:histidine kinase n=1 Tax=Polluticaenibacter yanchengensis TaxID=3014562 RepID=A0ABT4UF17_9BACT|nr:tetratricopeptide repeat protein [Chitinophagaceae bacterium LY-5]